MASEVESVPPVKDEKENQPSQPASDEGNGEQEQEQERERDQGDHPSEVAENSGGDAEQGDAGNESSTAALLSSIQMEGVPKELLVKHPLQYRWVLWYCKQDRSKDWEDCLKEVASFDTVEDFWALYNHIQLASGLSWGSDYYLFKEGIRPMWEDPHNIEGGRWLIVVDRNRRADLLDHYWLELLMAVIGEQFDDHGEQVCGLVINIRQKGDKVSLWTKDATKEEVIRRIGQVAKQKLGIAEQISYEQHKDTSHKSSSNVKARLRV